MNWLVLEKKRKKKKKNKSVKEGNLHIESEASVIFHIIFLAVQEEKTRLLQRILLMLLVPYRNKSSSSQTENVFLRCDKFRKACMRRFYCENREFDVTFSGKDSICTSEQKIIIV